MIYLPDNLWKSPVIQARLYQEACFECQWGISEKPHYWVIVPYADSKAGTNVLKNYEAGLTNADPHEIQQEFARIIYDGLMREAHYDGLWLVGYTHPPSTYGAITETDTVWGRLIAIWFDGHGDPQFTMESDLHIGQQLEAGEAYYVGLAMKSYEQWKEMFGPKAMKEDMMLHETQQRAEALEALK